MTIDSRAWQLQTAAIIPDHPPRRSSCFDRKEEVLNAAGALFNRHGLRDATPAVIVAEIGLNLKSLRYYFERREDLVAVAFMRSIELRRELAEDALAEDGIEPRVRRGGLLVVSASQEFLARHQREKTL